MTRPRALACLASLLVASLAATAAGAHGRSVSYSTWTLDGPTAEVRVRIALLELSRLGPVTDDAVAGAYLQERLVLRAGGERCGATSPPRSLASETGWRRYAWSVACDVSGPRSLESRVMLDVAPGHLHFARASIDGSSSLDRVLHRDAATWPLDRTAGGGKGGDEHGATGLAGFVYLGVEHILSGWDHLAFVLALLLLASHLREVAKLVTGFTVAHSITLGLAALGILDPDAAAVEALIAFSIALVAVENVWLASGRPSLVPRAVVALLVVLALAAAAGSGIVSPLTLAGVALFTGCHFALLGRVRDAADLRVAVAFAFGLVHGFGFAGVLSEMVLPTERLVLGLFGFNLGVELGQLAVVALLWPCLRAFARVAGPTADRLLVEAASAAVCGLAVFWFVTRNYG